MNVRSDVVLPQVNVLGSTMAYREAGNLESPVALFLHGNPTSSYIWRNIIPLVASTAHCIAPDLVGFGQSGKPDIEYRFADHVRYLDAFLANAGISSAFVIAHDWGTALAFHLAARRPEFIRGLAFMEFLRPLPTWEDFPAIARETFQKFRTPGVGEKMILEGDAFVEGVLPVGTARKLTDEEMSVYRAPFPTPESRRPTWRFPNELPIAGEPADVYSSLEKAHRALADSSYPKLLFAGNPGALISPAFAESFARGLTNCRVVQLGSGIHYLQEDQAEVIGAAVNECLIGLGVSSSPKNIADVGFVLGAQHTCHHERFAPRRKAAAVAAHFVNSHFWGAGRCPGRHPYYRRAGARSGELGCGPRKESDDDLRHSWPRRSFLWRRYSSGAISRCPFRRAAGSD